MGCALQQAPGLQHDGEVDHSAVQLRSARRRGLGGQNPAGPVEGCCGGRQGLVNGLHLARVDAELGAEAMPAAPRQVGHQAKLVVDLRRDARHRGRKVGQLKSWEDEFTRNRYTLQEVRDSIMAMQDLWRTSPESKPRGARSSGRRQRIRAVLDRRLAGHHSAEAVAGIAEEILEVLK